MAQDCYNRKYFLDRDHLDLHLAESIKILAEDNALVKILDVGCGTGQLVKFLNENGFAAMGCDLASEAIKIAHKRNRSKNILKASATKLPFKKNTLDLVLAISLIEHLTPKESQQFAAETYRVLKPGGFLFLITPNFWSPLCYLRGKKWLGYTDPSHRQFFTPRSLTKLLANHGFGKIRFRFKSAYNLNFDWHLPLFCRQLPRPAKNCLNWLMTSSPLSILRDVLWAGARKKWKKT